MFSAYDAFMSPVARHLLAPSATIASSPQAVLCERWANFRLSSVLTVNSNISPSIQTETLPFLAPLLPTCTVAYSKRKSSVFLPETRKVVTVTIVDEANLTFSCATVVPQIRLRDPV